MRSAATMSATADSQWWWWWFRAVVFDCECAAEFLIVHGRCEVLENVAEPLADCTKTQTHMMRMLEKLKKTSLHAAWHSLMVLDRSKPVYILIQHEAATLRFIHDSLISPARMCSCTWKWLYMRWTRVRLRWRIHSLQLCEPCRAYWTIFTFSAAEISIVIRNSMRMFRDWWWYRSLDRMLTTVSITGLSFKCLHNSRRLLLLILIISKYALVKRVISQPGLRRILYDPNSQLTMLNNSNTSYLHWASRREAGSSGKRCFRCQQLLFISRSFFLRFLPRSSRERRLKKCYYINSKYSVCVHT